MVPAGIRREVAVTGVKKVATAVIRLLFSFILMFLPLGGMGCLCIFLLRLEDKNFRNVSGRFPWRWS